MTAGVIRKWYAKEGERRRAYELLIDVEPNHLTHVGDDHNSILEIEVQEEIILAKRLFPTGQRIEVHAPIALTCEKDEECALCEDLTVSISPVEDPCDLHLICSQLISTPCLRWCGKRTRRTG